jgi:hypothetical protein
VTRRYFYHIFPKALEKVLKRLDVIDPKVSRRPQVQVSSRVLPTINALNNLIGGRIASHVSKVTGLARAFESKNLNELRATCLLSKQGQGRVKIFKSLHVDLPKNDAA